MGLIGISDKKKGKVEKKPQNIIEETTVPTQVLSNFKLNTACTRQDINSIGGGTVAGNTVSDTRRLSFASNFFVTSKGIILGIAYGTFGMLAGTNISLRINGQEVYTERDLVTGWNYLTDFANTTLMNTGNTEITLEVSYTQDVNFRQRDFALEIQGYWF